MANRKRFFVGQAASVFVVLSERSSRQQLLDEGKYSAVWGQFRTGAAASTFASQCNAGQVPTQAEVSKLNAQPTRVRKVRAPLPIPASASFQDAVQNCN